MAVDIVIVLMLIVMLFALTDAQVILVWKLIKDRVFETKCRGIAKCLGRRSGTSAENHTLTWTEDGQGFNCELFIGLHV